MIRTCRPVSVLILRALVRVENEAYLVWKSGCKDSKISHPLYKIFGGFRKKIYELRFLISDKQTLYFFTTLAVSTTSLVTTRIR